MTDITATRPPEASFLKSLRQTAIFKSVLVQPWTYTTGAVILAVVAGALLASTGRIWGVTTALTFWGAWGWEFVGGNPHSWTYFKDTAPGFNNPALNFFNDPATMIDVGLIFGALVSTLLASQFKVKNVKSTRQIYAAILGGLLMGFGARLSFGCNIGALFSGVPSMSLHGWVFMVFIFLGAMVGSKLLVMYFIGEASISTAPVPQAALAAAVAPAAKVGGIKRIQRTHVERKENTTQFPIGIAVLLVLIVICWYFFAVQKSLMLAIFWAFGIAFGFVLQRSRFCFTAAMRDPCLTGGTNLTKAVIVALAISTVLFTAMQASVLVKGGTLDQAMKIGYVAPVGIHTPIGAFMFGIGAVISGGCASGTLMRVGEGFVQQWIALPAFCIGGALGAVTWPVWKDLLMVDMKSSVFLPQLVGGFIPGVVLQFALLFGCWLLADWWSKRQTQA
jgi:uncharacterized membrane protein YedE/YeeE